MRNDQKRPKIILTFGGGACGKKAKGHRKKTLDKFLVVFNVFLIHKYNKSRMMRKFRKYFYFLPILEGAEDIVIVLNTSQKLFSTIFRWGTHLYIWLCLSVFQSPTFVRGLLKKGNLLGVC